jgi:hypothetical protein
LDISKCSGLDVFAIDIIAHTTNEYIHSTILYFLLARLYEVPMLKLRNHVDVIEDKYYEVDRTKTESITVAQ